MKAIKESRKFIIGWLTLRPGTRNEYMNLALPYIEACRLEEGCVFFEMNPSATDPDVVVVAECFADEDAHAAHLKTSTFTAFWAELNRLGRDGTFENIFADHVVPDSATFGVLTPPGVHS